MAPNKAEAAACETNASETLTSEVGTSASGPAKATLLDTPPPKKRRSRLGLVLKLVALLILLAVISAAILYAMRDRLIEAAVVHFGSAITGTAVEIESFKSAPFQGKVHLKGFRVANPAGYREAYALSVDTAELALEPRSVLTDRVRVRDIRISGAHLNLEPKLDGSTNLTDIQNNIQSFANRGGNVAAAEPAVALGTKSSSGTESSPETESAFTAVKTERTKSVAKNEKTASKQVTIDRLVIAGTGLTVTPPVLSTNLALKMPDIELTNLGGDGNLADLINQIALLVIGEVTAAAADSGFAVDNVNSLKETLQESVKEIKDTIKSGKDVKDSILKLLR